MKDQIGSHYSNDRHSLYEFSRRLDGPLHVERGISPDWLVVAVAIVCLAVALVWGW